MVVCKNCSSKLNENDRFCSKCGVEIPNVIKQSLQEAPLKESNIKTTRQLSVFVFIALIIISIFVMSALFSEKGIGTLPLSMLIAETSPMTAIGFFVAKKITKNKIRTWVEIVWFHIFNFIGGFISLTASSLYIDGGRPDKGLVALVFTFFAFMILFWLQNKSKIK